MEFGANGGLYKKLAKVWAPFKGWFAGGRRPVVMKESHEKCPSCKGKVRFLCSSPKLISQLLGAPSCNDASSRGLQNPKSSKASGDTNSEEVVTLDLNLSNKQTNKLFAGKSLYVRVVPVQPVWEPSAAPLPADVGAQAEEDPQALGVGGLI